MAKSGSGAFVSSEFDKVCVTAQCFTPHSGSLERFAVYVVDVRCSNSSDCPSMKPVLEFETFEFPGAWFAVLGTKLYLIGGMDRTPRPKAGALFGSAHYWNNHVYVYDLKGVILSCSLSTSQLRRSSVHLTLLHMNGAKYRPHSAVIDDHRICVFSAEVPESPPPGCTPPHFELFDARDDSWTPLPELPDSASGYLVSSFFVKCSTLAVMTNPDVLYRINFDEPNPQWEALPFCIPESCRFHHLGCDVTRGAIVRDPSVLCDAFKVLSMNADSPFTYPVPFEGGLVYAPPDLLVSPFTCPVPFQFESGRLYAPSGALFSRGSLFYTARAGQTSLLGFDFSLWIDILEFDDPLKPVTLKSFQFSLLDYCIVIEGCFPIKIEGASRSIPTLGRGARGSKKRGGRRSRPQF